MHALASTLYATLPCTRVCLSQFNLIVPAMIFNIGFDFCSDSSRDLVGVVRELSGQSQVSVGGMQLIEQHFQLNLDQILNSSAPIMKHPPAFHFRIRGEQQPGVPDLKPVSDWALGDRDDLRNVVVEGQIILLNCQYQASICVPINYHPLQGGSTVQPKLYHKRVFAVFPSADLRRSAEGKMPETRLSLRSDWSPSPLSEPRQLCQILRLKFHQYRE